MRSFLFICENDDGQKSKWNKTAGTWDFLDTRNKNPSAFLAILTSSKMIF